jgi:hypothetical protein
MTDPRNQAKSGALGTVAVGILLLLVGYVAGGINQESFFLFRLLGALLSFDIGGLSDVTAGSLFTHVQLAWLIGLVATIWGILKSWDGFARFLSTYWLAITFVVVLLFGLMLSEEAVERLRPIDRIPAWMTRILLILVLQGIGVAVFVKTRKPGSWAAERAAAAANVTFLLQIGAGLLLILNVIGSNHVTRWWGTYDATETGLYSLSDRTRGLLDSLADLPAPVHAVYLDFGTAQRGAPGREPVGNRAKDFLKQYGEYTPRFKLKEFNGILDQTEALAFLRELGIAEPDLPFEDTVLFVYRPDAEGEPHQKAVPVRSETFLEETRIGTRKFRGEQQFTTAIQDVTVERRKVYFLTGHQERPLYGTEDDSLVDAANLVRRLSLDVDKLSLAGRKRLPEDADLVIIAGPKRPLTGSDRDAIIDYLEDGGAMILLVDPQTSLLSPEGRPRPTGLESWLSNMGIDLRTEFRCVDYDLLRGRGATAGVTLSYVITTADYGGIHPAVEDLRDGRFAGVFNEAAPVLVDSSRSSDELSVDELVYMRRSPPGAPAYKTYAEKLFPNRPMQQRIPNVDIMDRHIPIGVAARRTLLAGPDGEERSTRVVVFGDCDFITRVGLNPRSQFFGTGNSTIFSNAVAWAVRSEQLISISPKTLELERTELTERQRRLGSKMSVYGVPLAVLFLALMVAWRRRR